MKNYLHTVILNMPQVVNTLLRQVVYEKVFAYRYMRYASGSEYFIASVSVCNLFSYSAESMQKHLHTVGRYDSVMLCMQNIIFIQRVCNKVFAYSDECVLNYLHIVCSRSQQSLQELLQM